MLDREDRWDIGVYHWLGKKYLEEMREVIYQIRINRRCLLV